MISLGATMAKKKYKKSWNSKEEWEARNARVDQSIRRLRKLAEKGWAELERKNPELKNL
jgi:hypothetical protein